MPWSQYNQGQLKEIDTLGAELSIAIGCGVHYPAYDKNIFECRCGVAFPLYLVKGRNWQLILRKHEEERVYSRK